MLVCFCVHHKRDKDTWSFQILNISAFLNRFRFMYRFGRSNFNLVMYGVGRMYQVVLKNMFISLQCI